MGPASYLGSAIERTILTGELGLCAEEICPAIYHMNVWAANKDAPAFSLTLSLSVTGDKAGLEILREEELSLHLTSYSTQES